MSATTTSPDLISFEEAQPIGEHDAAFVTELRDLLERHSNIDRFGLCLLHDHFAVKSDELLMETNDPQRRTLTVTPEHVASLPEFKATMWRMTGTDAAASYGASRGVQVLQGVPCQVLQGCEHDKCK
jgi:hypothetical protein